MTHLGHGIRSHRSERLFDRPREGSYSAADKDGLLVLALFQKGQERGGHSDRSEDVGVMYFGNRGEILPVDAG